MSGEVAQVPRVVLSVVPAIAGPDTVGRTVAVGTTAAITLVCTEVVVPEPDVFAPVWVTRIVEPTSALTSTYPAVVAPAIGTHWAPTLSQRSHWYVNVVGALFQIGMFARNAFWRAGVPEIVMAATTVGSGWGRSRRWGRSPHWRSGRGSWRSRAP